MADFWAWDLRLQRYVLVWKCYDCGKLVHVDEEPTT